MADTEPFGCCVLVLNCCLSIICNYRYARYFQQSILQRNCHLNCLWFWIVIAVNPLFACAMLKLGVWISCRVCWRVGEEKRKRERGRERENGSAAAGAVERERPGAAPGDGRHARRLPGGLYGDSSRFPQREEHPYVDPTTVRPQIYFYFYSFSLFIQEIIGIIGQNHEEEEEVLVCLNGRHPAAPVPVLSLLTLRLDYC